MKIKTKLGINALLPLGLVVLTAVVLTGAARHIAVVTEQGRVANAIVKDVFELTIVADEYMLSHGERAHKQWGLKYGALGERLAQLAPREPRERAILERVRAEHQGLRATFAELTENHHKQVGNQARLALLDQQMAPLEASAAGRRKAPADETALAEIARERVQVRRESATLAELNARLVGQLLAKSQAMVSGGLQLAQINQLRVADAERQAAWIIFAAVLIAGLILIVTSGLITRGVLRPLARVTAGTEIVGRGNLDYRLNLKSQDEVGELARTFDRMLDNLRSTTASRDELTRAHAELKNSTTALVQSEKMASIGQMVAGVAHEINTPLAYVRSSVEIVKDQMPEIERLIAAYSKLTELLLGGADDATLQNQFQQVQQLAAAFHGSYSLADSGDLLARSLHGLDQIRELVLNLKNFSRLDRERVTEFNLNEGLDSVLLLARPVLKARVKVIKEYGEVPYVSCSPSQINQVFLNLLTNAAQAIEAEVGGTVTIQTRAAGDRVEVSIRDNGKGIAPELLPKIFEPFFTTKKVGEGTGLGLSISKKIVDEHGGSIRVESAVGKGSAFIVSLPAAQAINQRKRA